MSTLGIILIVIAGVLVLLFLGGLAMSARRRANPRTQEAILAADRALAQAHASDRGWDRSLLESACKQALAAERPDFECSALELVLVDDRPGVVEDRAHYVASGPAGQVRIVLARDEGGAWSHEQVE